MILNVENLNVNFHTRDEIVEAVKGVDLKIKDNTIVGLIGETGCGKSVLGRSIMKLLPQNTRVEGGIFYKGEDITSLSEKKMQRLRGSEIALIPQNPSKSLNPILKIKTQLVECFRKYWNISRDEAREKSVELLHRLNFPSPNSQLDKYPHQLSGGMNQRVLAAMAMSKQPSLLIADEPTKGLDAVIRSQVVGLIRELKEVSGSSILLITHDLKVATRLCDEIGVMYGGELVEFTEADLFIDSPLHPYSKALLESLPERGLNPIKTVSPEISTVSQSGSNNYSRAPSGCNFYHYCSRAISKCKSAHPPMQSLTNGQLVRCFLNDRGKELNKKISCSG